jgi:hypothetical protein
LHPSGLIRLSFCQLLLQWCPGDESIIWNPLNCTLKLLMERYECSHSWLTSCHSATFTPLNCFCKIFKFGIPCMICT